MTTPKQNFARSYDVQQLVDKVSRLAIGERLTYDHLAAVVGMTWPADRARLTTMIQSARRIVLAEKIVLGTVRGVGIERLDGEAIIKSGSQSISRIRRESVRGLRRLACVEYGSLNNAAKTKHDATAAHLGVLGEFAKPKTFTKLTDATDKKQEKLTLDETLKAFRE